MYREMKAKEIMEQIKEEREQQLMMGISKKRLRNHKVMRSLDYSSRPFKGEHSP